MKRLIVVLVLFSCSSIEQNPADFNIERLFVMPDVVSVNMQARLWVELRGLPDEGQWDVMYYVDGDLLDQKKISGPDDIAIYAEFTPLEKREYIFEACLRGPDREVCRSISFEAL